MSRKVDARSNRIGITKGWNSKWFAEGESYANNLIEDYKIRKVINKKLRSAGLNTIIIERSLKNIKIILTVAKPGIVIGRKGSGLADLRAKLSKITKTNLELLVEEAKNPETHAKIIADTIAMQIERRYSAKRAINIAADKAMQKGAKGIKLQVGGTIFGPSSIATVVKTIRGAVPTQTLRVDIDFAKATAFTRGGSIGIKVWVNKGDLGPKSL